MTVAELWEYCVANGLCDHEIVVETSCGMEMDYIEIDNVECHFDGKIYLEGE